MEVENYIVELAVYREDDKTRRMETGLVTCGFTLSAQCPCGEEVVRRKALEIVHSQGFFVRFVRCTHLGVAE